MGRKRTGSKRFKDGMWLVEMAGEHLASFETETEAERFRRAAEREAQGFVPDAFAEFGEAWIDAREKDAQRRKRLRSFAKDRSCWHAHIETAKFWDFPIKKITPLVVQEWIGSMFEKEAMQTVRQGARGTVQRGLGRTISRRVVEQALKQLKLCLDSAVIAGKLESNPARLAKLPRDEVKEHDGELIVHLALDEIGQLLSFEGLPLLPHTVFTVAMFTGLREDELWGLRWQDVLLEGKRPELRVRRSYDGPCKSKTSIRDVPLLPPARAALRAWRAAQSTAPIAGLVFPGADGKCHHESYTAGWRDKPRRTADGKRVVERGWRSLAGIRAGVHFKDLRHTCGCHLAQGSWTRPLSLMEIKRWLGHSTIAVTEKHYATFTSANLHNAIAEDASDYSHSPRKTHKPE